MMLLTIGPNPNPATNNDSPNVATSLEEWNSGMMEP
jgi:hypothetical protein